MNMNFENRIVIGLTAFCTKCMNEISSAGPNDMNGNIEYCKNCDHSREITIGISLHSDSLELLKQAHEDMQKSHHLIEELLKERNQ